MAFNKEKEAKRVYTLFQKVCEGYKFKYDKDDQYLRVEFDVAGDNYTVNYIMLVNPKIDVAYILSTLPVKVGEMCSDDVAQAVNLINSRLAVGSMDYSAKKNEIVYRAATNYTEMELTQEAVQALVMYTYSSVNKYNSYLCKVANGDMSFEQFRKMVEGE